MPTLTYDPTPADQPEFNESEVEALKVGEQQAAAENQMLAGKFKTPADLEQAYLELQKKLGAPRDEVQTTDEGEAEAAPEEEVESDDTSIQKPPSNSPEKEEQDISKLTSENLFEFNHQVKQPQSNFNNDGRVARQREMSQE